MNIETLLDKIDQQIETTVLMNKLAGDDNEDEWIDELLNNKPCDKHLKQLDKMFDALLQHDDTHGLVKQSKILVFDVWDMQLGNTRTVQYNRNGKGIDLIVHEQKVAHRTFLHKKYVLFINNNQFPFPSIKRVKVMKAMGLSYGKKLNPELVRYIRKSKAHGEELAKEIGVSITTIASVRKKQSWAWVE